MILLSSCFVLSILAIWILSCGSQSRVFLLWFANGDSSSKTYVEDPFYFFFCSSVFSISGLGVAVWSVVWFKVLMPWMLIALLLTVVNNYVYWPREVSPIQGLCRPLVSGLLLCLRCMFTYSRRHCKLSKVKITSFRKLFSWFFWLILSHNLIVQKILVYANTFWFHSIINKKFCFT